MRQLSRRDLHQYQVATANQISRKPCSMLWLPLGAGKTISILTAFEAMQQLGKASSMLVVAPLRVCQLVWRQEGLKWEHTKHLTFSLVCGSAKKRTRALFRKADIYLINYESLTWLAVQLEHYFINEGRPLPFNMLVFDEVSKVKRSSSKRFAAFSPLAKYFDTRVGLTASPCSNGLHDLWAQFFMLDDGDRLGADYKTFQSAFFYQVGQANHNKWEAYDDTKDMIVSRINDITVQMEGGGDDGRPPLTVIDVEVVLPPRKFEQYKALERDFYIELDDGGEIEVFNRAALCNKLIQFSGGRVYNYPDPDDKTVRTIENVHDEKYKALDDLIDGSGDDPILLAYSFTSERMELMKRYPEARCLTGVGEQEAIEITNAFNAGQIKLLIAHPACLGADTEVLTEGRGWVKITKVRNNERVFDGVEFVAHGGCSYSGYTKTIDVFGIRMTPKHKILINDNWVEGENVRTCGNTQSEACYTYTGNDDYISEMCQVRCDQQNRVTESTEAQQIGTGVLQRMRDRQTPHDVTHKISLNLAAYEGSSARPHESELFRSRYNLVPRMVEFSKLLRRHVCGIRGYADDRTDRREQGLREVELRVDDNVRSAGEQTVYAEGDLQRCTNAFSAAMSRNVPRKDDAATQTEQRDERGRGCRGCEDVDVQQARQTPRNIDRSLDDCPDCEPPESITSDSLATPEEKSCGDFDSKEHVYDLIDCGVRSRFLIRNASGEMFISHNSAAHGINLQAACHTIVWFGLSYNLEFYEQFNGRINRQGQTQAVQCFRIVCVDTMDYAVMDALAHKDETQSAMKDAIGRHRGVAITSEVIYDQTDKLNNMQ